MDKRLFWELMKMEIRSATISFSKSKAKCISNWEQELRRRTDQLDVIICDNFSFPYIDGVLQEYNGLKMELKSIYEEKRKQAKFRAKCRWIQKGEHPTKYFFNLEKSNYNKKKLSMNFDYKMTLLRAIIRLMKEPRTDNFWMTFFIGRTTFYALSAIWTHVPLITGRVWSPLHYQSNPAVYTSNLDSEWEFYVVLPISFSPTRWHWNDRNDDSHTDKREGDNLITS